MEADLHRWCLHQEKLRVPLTAKMIKTKARELSKHFPATKDWLDRFRAKFNVHFAKETSSGTYDTFSGQSAGVTSQSDDGDSNYEEEVVAVAGGSEDYAFGQSEDEEIRVKTRPAKVDRVFNVH